MRTYITGLDQTIGYLDKSAKAIDTASRIGIRVEANRLRLRLKEEIKAGAPGGQSFAPLSIIARRMATRAGVERRPLARLAIPVRYWEQSNAEIQQVIVGFTGGKVLNIKGDMWESNQLSKSWTRLAIIHQDGFSKEIPDLGRSLLRRLGGKLKKQGWADEARFYFLRKTTKQMKVPARPIINPFWAAHEAEAIANIRQNFSRKLQGERI